MTNRIHTELGQLVTNAISEPTAENYTALLNQHGLSFQINQDSMGYLIEALTRLDFTNPPVDLGTWFKHWYDCIERNPELFENVELPKYSPQWALCTLAKAVGFAYQSTTFLNKRALNTDMMAQAFSQAINASNKAKEHGKHWVEAINSMQGLYCQHLVAMLSLTVLPDATTDLMVALDSYHRKWAQLAETDLSAALLAVVMGESKKDVFSLVMEWHDRHNARCAALYSALAPSASSLSPLPDNLSGTMA